jgi:hypothetical protein
MFDHKIEQTLPETNFKLRFSFYRNPLIWVPVNVDRHRSRWFIFSNVSNVFLLKILQEICKMNQIRPKSTGSCLDCEGKATFQSHSGSLNSVHLHSMYVIRG